MVQRGWTWCPVGVVTKAGIVSRAASIGGVPRGLSVASDSYTVNVTTRFRRMWALRIAGWFLTLPRVEVYADGRKLSGRGLEFSIQVEDVEVGKVEP